MLVLWVLNEEVPGYLDELFWKVPVWVFLVDLGVKFVALVLIVQGITDYVQIPQLRPSVIVCFTLIFIKNIENSIFPRLNRVYSICFKK